MGHRLTLPALRGTPPLLTSYGVGAPPTAVHDDERYVVVFSAADIRLIDLIVFFKMLAKPTLPQKALARFLYKCRQSRHSDRCR